MKPPTLRGPTPSALRRRFDGSRRHLLCGLGSAAALSAVPGCVSTNPATGRTSFTGLYSIEDDIKLGRAEHPGMVEAFGGEYQHPRLNRYVSAIGNRLAAHAEYQQFPYRFTILNSPIVNAFALPGGYVYLSRGLLALASNEAEVAGVLGHEIGHVNARHGAERQSAAQLAQLGIIAAALGASQLGVNPGTAAQLGQGVAGLALSSYSRGQELESDTLGVRYLASAGYDPQGMVSFLAALREQSQLEARTLGLPPGSLDETNFMATHPRTVDRVETATRAAAAAVVANPRLGRDDFLGNIDGMLFADDPAQGYARGRHFQHTGLRLEFTVPEGFRIQNSPSSVVAKDRRGAGMVFDVADAREPRDPAAYIRNEWAPKAKLEGLRRTTLGGSPAAQALAAAQMSGGSAAVRLVAIARDARSLWRFMFITPGGENQSRAGQYDAVLRSFRPLSAEQAAAIKPLRLLVVEAQSGDTVEKLSRNLPYGPMNADWFRLLNDLGPGEQPARGQRIKVVAS